MPRRFRFRHPLVRRAVYDSTPGGWRLGAHERCAAALAALGAPAADRAHHVQRSARQGDSAAVAVLREAGEAAAQRAPASAAIWFGDALRLLPETAPADVRVELLLARARMLAATGQFAEGHSALLESLGLVPPEAVALRVRLTTACAGIEHLVGRHEDAHARLVSAMESLRDPESPEAAALMIELAMDGFFLMEYERMRAWAERALRTARPLGDRPLTAAATALLAFASAASGATADAEAHRTEAAALVDALADDELALRLDAAANLAGAELYLDHYERRKPTPTERWPWPSRPGRARFIPLPYSILGQVKLLRGQLEEASDMLDNAVESARLSGNVQALAGNLVQRSLTAVAAGDLDLALSTAKENVELTQGWTRVSSARPAWRSPPRSSNRRRRSRRRRPRPVLGRRRARAHPGRVEGQIPRAADPLLARARPPGRGRTRGHPRGGRRRPPEPPRGAFDGRASPRGCFARGWGC